MTLPLLLASSSPFRRDLLTKLGLPFSHAAPDIDESPLDGECASSLVERLSIQKANALAQAYPAHLIIGSDQVAVNAGVILGKPHTKERAIAQLQACRGNHVTFYTGLAVLNSQTGSCFSCIEPFSVHFRELTDAQITRYIEQEEPFQCAGSFKSEGLGITLFKRMQGDDPNALVGLPLIRLVDLLARHGLELP